MKSPKNKIYTITKKVAKHGSQAVIIIPRVLEEQLRPGTLLQINMEVLDGSILEEEN